MDTVLVKTFLEVVSCNSFANAAERLYVSQSAVSLRIKSLEEQLGRPVFSRSKSGVKLTPAGQQLIRYANSFLQIWEEAKQQVAVPEQYEDVLVIAAEQGLWERLLIRWLPHLAELLPSLAFRAEEGKSANIVRQMVAGTTDVAVLYKPQLRPGLQIQHLFDEEITLVSTNRTLTEIDSNYIFVDWGEEFTNFHHGIFPDIPHARMTFRLGQVTLNYLLNNEGSAFMPRRLVQPFLDSEKLFVVEEIPVFSMPVHLTWRIGLDSYLFDKIIDSLQSISQLATNNQLPAPFWRQ